MSYTRPTVLSLHMTVNLQSILKRLHAHPTDMRLTHPTRHMIASFRLLDRHLAFRTLLYVVTRRPFPEQVITVVHFGARQPFVCFGMTVGADMRQAFWA